MTEKQKIKNKLIYILKRNGVSKASLFGSLVTGTFSKRSDVDILVEFKGRKTLLDLAGLQIKLEDSLGRKVDLLTFKSLHPLLRPRILKEQEKII
jgi:predicted nucleotidyltransferase